MYLLYFKEYSPLLRYFANASEHLKYKQSRELPYFCSNCPQQEKEGTSLNKYFRWPTWLILATIVMVALIPTIPLFHSGKTMAVHAAASGGNTTPMITLSASIVRPRLSSSNNITITGQGFTPGMYLIAYLDSINNNSLGFFTVDNNGNFSGVVAMPKSEVQGQHEIIITAINNSFITSAAITYVPAVFITAGKPGLPVQLNGAAFTANETVQVYFGANGGILEGSSTTDSNGNLSYSFTLPTGLSGASYPVAVIRTNQKPSKVTSQIKIIPVTMISTPGIRSGQMVNVRVAGFLPLETVTFSWNANGGQYLYALAVDALGAAKLSFYPPSAPPGTYSLTALGKVSGEQISNPLALGPGISTMSSNPGSTTYVTGGGFNANELVNVYFQNPGNGVVSATTDSTGSFNVSLTLPTTYNPGTTYYIYAKNVAGTEHTRTKFTFYTLAFYVGDAYYHQPAPFTGANFATGETVTIIWNYQHAGQFTVGTIIADASGDFNLNLPTPSTPNQSSIVVAAIGATSKLVATITIQNFPVIYLQPAMGTAGQQVQVTGGSFGSAESVTLTFQGVAIATATTQTDGTFTSTFKVPTAKGAGNITVQATGSSSGISATAIFTYIPTLIAVPNIVKNGDTITVTGKHFSANATVSITPLYNLQGITATTDANGLFVANFPISGFSSGTNYLEASDDISYITVTVAIIVQ